MEDRDSFYALYSKATGAQSALKFLKNRRQTVAVLEPTVEDPPSLDAAQALPETRKVNKRIDPIETAPMLPESDLLRRARGIITTQLTKAVMDDLRNQVAAERVEDMWDHRTQKDAGMKARSGQRLAEIEGRPPSKAEQLGSTHAREENEQRRSSTAAVDLPLPELSPGKSFDRPARLFTKTAAVVGDLPSFGRRRTRSGKADDDGWGYKDWAAPKQDAPDVSKFAAGKVSKIDVAKLQTSQESQSSLAPPGKSPPKASRTRRHVPEIVFTSSEEDGSEEDEEEATLSEKLKKARANKSATTVGKTADQQLRDSSPLSAVSDMTVEEVLAIPLHDEALATKVVEIGASPKSPDLKVDIPGQARLTSAEAIASLPTPAPTESSTASLGKRELSIDNLDTNEPNSKRVRIASPEMPLSTIKPTCTKSAPKAAKGKKGSKQAKKAAAAAAARARRAAPEEDGPSAPEATLTPADLGIIDEEDLYYLKLALLRRRAGVSLVPESRPEPHEDLARPKHDTGSARTEGYYKIAQIEKLSYLAARNQARAEAGASSSIAVSRSARVNARSLASGLDKHKKATANDTDILQFNQLRTRKKQMRFARSPIHDWGLYAMEQIPAGEMVIEYVGESIRQQVADKREKMYERQGIGSSYLL